MTKTQKRRMSETILIETESFVLKVVTSHETIKTPIIQNIKYQLPGSDGEVMGGQLEAGTETEERSTHTITLSALHKDGGTTVLTCDGIELRALIQALGKALASAGGPGLFY